MRRILIAEDDLTTRELLCVILQKNGFDVTAVADGNRAWEELDKDDSPDLVILDWYMPGHDGHELCMRIHEQDTDRARYVMILTSCKDANEREAVFACSADDVLTKPFQSDEVIRRIKLGFRILDLEAEVRRLSAERTR